MNITHIFWSFTIGGAELLVFELIKRQSMKNNINLIVINDKFDDKLIDELKTYCNVILIKRKAGSINLKYIIKFLTVVYKSKTDILHCHQRSLGYLIIPFLKPAKILTVHNNEYKKSKFFSWTMVVAVTKNLKNKFMLSSHERIEYVYNGIHLNEFKKKYTNKFNFLNFVCVGRILFNPKGQDILLNAIKELKETGRERFKLTFIGDGPDKEKLKTQVELQNLEKNVELIENFNHSDIKNNLKDYDILVQPSIKESFGLVIIEAAAVGLLKIIKSDLSSNNEISEQINNIETFKLNKLDTLVQILSCSYDDFYQKKLKANVNLNNLKVFSFENMYKKYQFLYKIANKS